MFGSPKPPKPPRHEPFVLLGLAVVIAASLTLVAYVVLVLSQRMEQAG